MDSLSRMKRVLFFLMMCIPLQAWAIINAEDMDQSGHQDGVIGKIGLSANGSSGNSSKLHGEGSGRVVWKHAAHTDMLVGSYAYGKSQGKRDTNKAFAHLRHRYALDEQWEVEGFGQLQQNEFANLKLRTLLGGGLRWSREDTTWMTHLGLGSFYERESLRTANSPGSTLWRMNSYWSLAYHLNQRVRMQNTVYYQPAWKNSRDFRLLNDAVLTVSLTEQLNLRLSLETTHDSRPPAGIKPTDHNYKTGLEFVF